MSNPYGWQSCGGSHGANIAARQQQSRQSVSGSRSNGGRSGGGGSSRGSEFFTIIVLSGVVAWIANAIAKGNGPVAGVVCFVVLFFLWRSKNKAESQTSHSAGNSHTPSGTGLGIFGFLGALFMAAIMLLLGSGLTIGFGAMGAAAMDKKNYPMACLGFVVMAIGITIIRKIPTCFRRH